MEERLKELLPIGTVVTLKNGVKKLMIFGIIQTMDDNPDAEKNGEYDYIGVPYPEGNMGQDYQYLFNHSDIERIWFLGFEDIERQEFIYKLGEYYRSGGQTED